FAALDPCVHCGFCLPACPTYLATGDESDSPRGRIVLMRELERGDSSTMDSGLIEHLESCLGCRGCEPACPSGVEYGRAFETARRALAATHGVSLPLRVLLYIFSSTPLWRSSLTLARWLRSSGLPSRLSANGRIGFAMGMLAATRQAALGRSSSLAREADAQPARADGARRPTVALFRGCVMDTLFDHVHEATRRTLAANGYTVIEVPGQVCCGALHDHAGAHRAARSLASSNVDAFTDRADLILVNSAGCGALMKDYGHLLGTDAAKDLAGRVKDVSELLSQAGPRRGEPLPYDVAYDAPCHLQHAQGLIRPPLDILGAVPGLRLQVLPGAHQCCGSAGLYSVVRPTMARAVLDAKIDEIASLRPRPKFVATGNPGCIMQIGAGLAAAGLEIAAAHPVEFLDRSYELAGFYQPNAPQAE
ncbi:MAG: (Fe-S)-binding protein, partial [Gemmatimonadales bacterium]|nr:(Fe-S)-binding protein [Gemmatimonadales bacterium]